MRILYLHPIGALGGAERSLLDIFAALRALEPSWELRLISGADGALNREAERLGVRTETLPLPDELLVLNDSARGGSSGKVSAAFRLAKRAALAGVGAKHCAAELRARIEELKPDIVHSNGVKFHLLTRLMDPLRVPVVWHIRDFIGVRNAMRRALRWAAPAASLAIANSNAVAADARAVLRGVPIRTIFNCVDTERFSPGAPSGASLDERSGIPAAEKGVLRVGLVASYARWKGQDLFLKAAALLKEHAPDLCERFYIIGGPIHKTQGSQFSVEELRKLTGELGIAENMGFVPFQDAPEEIYRALDVVVHCSTQPEPFGRTIAEAMSCGRAVVATLAGGAIELFRPGGDAMGVKPNDALELARTIEELLRNPGLRESLGINARRAALDRFSRARLGLELRDAYSSLIENSRA